MARYDNERPPRIPGPDAHPASPPGRDDSREEGPLPSSAGGSEGGPHTLVPRKEWLPKYHFDGGGKPPPHYRHEGYGHEKEPPKRPGKLGSGHGIGAVPRSPLPKGVTSITVFQPEILMSLSGGWVKPAAGVRQIQDELAAREIPCWEDKKRDVTAAANISAEEATILCLRYNVPSFIHINFWEAWDSFHTLHLVKGRNGMKKKREHRITGISPAEVLDKVESTIGMTIPTIPAGICGE